jgi:peptidoglycan-associated lipoprotein
MQLKAVCKLTVLLALASLMSVGCAKKPMTDDSNQVTQTEMQQDTVADVSEQPITETASSSSQDSSAQSSMDQMVSSLMRVSFEYDQYVLTADAREVLKKNAIYLKAKGARVQIEGHCDERGSDEYNLALGENRALTVKNYLVSLGVPADRMSIISYGEEIPLVMAHNEEAWAQNRRVEFKELY